MKLFGSVFALALGVILSSPVHALPREADWAQVRAATENKLPKTAASLLAGIQRDAFADQAWAEGAKALAMRVALENKPVDEAPDAVKQLAAEISGAPPAARPVLALLEAKWLHSYYQRQQWKLGGRSVIATPTGDAIETWDKSRMLAEIDSRFRDSLADQAVLKKIPIRGFDFLLDKGQLGDELRPTLYDFLAHAALEFYSMSETPGGDFPDAFEFNADSPALGAVDAFRAWNPNPQDSNSPKYRALRIYQDLLAFHEGDPDRSAFLHCDLQRLRWAGETATEWPDRQARLDAALRSFMAANAKHPVSADARIDVAGSLISLNRTKEAHQIAKTGAEAFPGHAFGKLCQNIVASLEDKEVFVMTSTLWTGSGEQITVSHANVSHLWFRIYQQPWKASEATVNSDPSPDGGYSLSEEGQAEEERELSKFFSGKPAKAWDVALPDDHDFAPRCSNLPVPSDLPPGYYVLVASHSPGFERKDNTLSFSCVHVSRRTMVTRLQNGKFTGFVTDARTGAPAAKVAVKCYLEERDKKRLKTYSTQSDADGWFSFPNFKSHGDHLLVVAGSGNDRVIHRTNAYGGDEYEDPEPEEGVEFFTDRRIYRPGDTIYFKGIWCRADRAKGKFGTLSKKKTTVKLCGANGKEIQKLELIGNEYGSFSGTFILPHGEMAGEYVISAEIGGGIRVSVEEYKRPKFSATLNPPEAAVTLDRPVTVTGRALAYTGAPVDGAKVQWLVTRGTRWPEWMRWSGFSPDRPNDMQIASGTVTSAADGTFSIVFSALPDSKVDPETNPIFHYQIHADVTEPSGETVSLATSVAVSRTALAAKITADEWQVADQPVKFRIRTSTHNDIGQPAEGNLKIHKLKEPEVCPRGGDFEEMFDDAGADVFPPDQSANPARWELAAVVAEIPVKTSGNDNAEFDRGEIEIKTSLPAGAYRAVFTSQDANGILVHASHQLQVVNPEHDRFPTKVPFYVVSNSKKVEPGQSMSLVWGSGHPEARACIEWFSRGRLLKREWSAPGRTQQCFQFSPDESMCGYVSACVTQTTLNCLQEMCESIEIARPNRSLNLRWEHISSKLQPDARDTWTAVISGSNGTAATAEMAATLYDASLDAFVPHFAPDFEDYFDLDDGCPIEEMEMPDQIAEGASYWYWDRGGYFHLEYPYRRFADRHILQSGYPVMERRVPERSILAYPHYELANSVGSSAGSWAAMDPFGSMTATGGSDANGEVAAPASPFTARKNLRETAFFYPHLTPNDKGEVCISFTMPEALTKWRFIGFAHDKEMRYGELEGETVTAKDLMVQPNPPRFLREGDVIAFTVKISNQSDQDRTGTARLALSDAATLKDVTGAICATAAELNWTVPAKQSRTLSWRLSVPDGTGLLNYRATATSGDLTDGEDGCLPVIPRRMWLTESMNLPVRDKGAFEFAFPKLLQSAGSKTIEHRSLDVQCVSQPTWYAVMALPYLMEFPHDCAEQTFNRYYSNALARHLANRNPQIRQIFELWKNTPALESPLFKNADIKGILLDETPWLAEASDQSQARRDLGLLFDHNRLDHELSISLKRFSEMQGPDGLWPWFSGGPGNEYISLCIATGLARLRAMGVEADITPALKALPAFDGSLRSRLAAIRAADLKNPGALDANHLDPITAKFLYTRTLFLNDRNLSPEDRVAFDFFVNQAKQNWAKLDSRMSRAHIALALSRLGDLNTAKLITRSLKENATNDKETGMFWQDAEGGVGWYWWQSPIETQAMMIEAFREVDEDDKAVEDCKVWLIKQKQVRDWRTTTGTSDAIHALLSGGRSLLGAEDSLQISLGGSPVKPVSMEPGTGYFDTRISGSEIKPEMGNIKLEKTDSGIAWAGVHWQYFEDIAKVTDHQSSALKLEKSLFVRRAGPQGARLEPVAGPVKVGDELVTRLVLRNDRIMEFVHLKDQRGSGTEPVNVLSGYRKQDGLGFYEVTRDAASHFFIDELPAGTHVFETSVRVQHAGTYQSGIAEIRCMYAPEFGVHSGSVAITVDQ